MRLREALIVLADQCGLTRDANDLRPLSQPEPEISVLVPFEPLVETASLGNQLSLSHHG